VSHLQFFEDKIFHVFLVLEPGENLAKSKNLQHAYVLIIFRFIVSALIILGI